MSGVPMDLIAATKRRSGLRGHDIAGQATFELTEFWCLGRCVGQAQNINEHLRSLLLTPCAVPNAKAN